MLLYIFGVDPFIGCQAPPTTIVNKIDRNTGTFQFLDTSGYAGRVMTKHLFRTTCNYKIIRDSRKKPLSKFV